MQEITRFLENLYGASIEGDASKRGENHVLYFRLTVPAPAYLPDGEKVLWEGMRFLGTLFADPHLEGELFPAEIVAQEKRNLENLIRSLINHREHYAVERLIRVMCRGERFARYEYGNLDDLPGISPATLTRYWREILRRRPLLLFAVGDVEPERVAEEALTAFGWERGSVEIPPATERKPAPDRPRRVEEPFPLAQEYLVQGYRCSADLTGEDFPAFLFFNGLLGGFAFSRLFKRVREQEGLVYDISSHVERQKGLLLVSAGVQPGRSDHVVRLVAEALEAMRGGEITDEEVGNARKRLLSEIRALPDAASLLIHAAQDALLAGSLLPLSEVEARFARVTREDVVRLASSVALDTTYVLKPGTEAPVSGG
jgi:predicted Zn-dependent peptidase